jgi:SAM-dependent methyltransferase
MGPKVYAKEPLAVQDTIPVFSNPSDYITNYEQIAADHLAHFYQHGSNPWIKEDLWGQMENSTADLVKKFSKPGDMILDVGVGLGRLLSRFPNLQRYGMDISFGYLEIAQSQGIDVCYAMIEDMPYKECLFDIVVCTDVLEHVVDLNLSCAKMLAVLKQGGFLIVRTPFREDLSLYLSPTYPYQYAHLRNFDENSLRLLFERVFNCEYIEMTTAGYDYKGGSRRLKYRFHFPKRDFILIHLLSALKVIHPPACEVLLQALYYPIEINIVFRKT